MFQNTNAWSPQIGFPAYTVGTLPAAVSNKYVRYFVSDALTPVTLAAIVGGGAVTVPVWSNGTIWVVG
jgi:hypothetical protein